MVLVDCPYPGCTFNTGKVADALAAMLLQIHASGSHSGGTPDVGQNNVTSTTAAARVKEVRCHTISAGSSNEAWLNFNIRWRDYVTATKITGQDCVIKFLECCDEDLRKDLTGTAGGTCTMKTEEEVLAAIKILADREENAMVARVTFMRCNNTGTNPLDL